MITINGYTLLDEQADWSSAAPKWRLTWDTEIVPTLRGNEGRSALRPAARPAYSFTQQPTRIERQAAAAAAIRAALVSGKACAPIYGRASWLTVAAAAGAGALTIDPTPWPWAVGDWFVVASDGISEAHQITAVAGSILTLASGLGMALPIDTAVYPLIFGRPELEDITQTNGSISTFPIKITGEVYRPAVAAPATCAGALGVPVQRDYLGRPLFEFSLDWANGITRQMVYDQRSQQIGFGGAVNEPLQQYASEGFEIGLNLPTHCAIDALERFFSAIYGRLQGWWLPSPAWEVDIIAAISSSQFLVRNSGLAAAWATLPALHLYLRQDGVWPGEAAKVANVEMIDAQTERITLTEPLMTGVPDSGWVAQRLLYVRLLDDEVELEFRGEGWAGTTFRAYELPVEYASVELGQRPTFGYHFWRIVAGVRTDWRYTSFDQPVYLGTVAEQNTFTPAPISHASIDRGMGGEKEKLDIKTWRFDGSPLNNWLPYAPMYDLFVEVFEADLSSGSPDIAVVLFSGLVETVQPKGRAVDVNCTTRLDRLNSRIPRFRVQLCCNYALYGPCCKVSRAAYSYDATVTNMGADGVSIALHAAGIGGRADSWFQWGDAQSADAAGLPEYRTIVSSTTGGGDAHSIRLNAPLSRTPVVGDVITISAGCNLDFSSPNGCQKFGNQVNFGGHPHITENLTLKAIKLKQPASGKGG